MVLPLGPVEKQALLEAADTSARAKLLAAFLEMAVFEPTPKRVQSAVRNCVHSIIVLDAAVCIGYASPYWGFAVLSLLLPTMLLTLWLNAT